MTVRALPLERCGHRRRSPIRRATPGTARSRMTLGRTLHLRRIPVRAAAKAAAGTLPRYWSMKASTFCSSTTNLAASTLVAVRDSTESTAVLISSASASTASIALTMLAAILAIVAASARAGDLPDHYDLGDGHDNA